MTYRTPRTIFDLDAFATASANIIAQLQALDPKAKDIDREVFREKFFQRFPALRPQPGDDPPRPKVHLRALRELDHLGVIRRTETTIRVRSKEKLAVIAVRDQAANRPDDKDS